MKNILLLVHDDEGQESRVQAALDLTRALGGHLTCIDVVPPVIIAGDLYAGFGEGAIISDERKSEARNKAALTGRFAHEDVSWDWIDAYGDIASCVLKFSTLADLVVLSRKLDDYPLPDMHGIASKILMHARVPIVAVPEDLPMFDLTGKVVIAWDGQSSVIATMKACVPLLRLAREVEIFTVLGGEVKSEPTEAAKYLSRHGIDAEVRVIERGGEAEHLLIADECQAGGASYVLMGAYNHGRLIETFGGTTRRMLSESKMPLVLGH